MEIFGKIKKLFNLGYLETNFSKIPSKISLSVPDGRCDPCCSTEEKGKTSILFLPIFLISSEERSVQNFDSISDI